MFNHDLASYKLLYRILTTLQCLIFANLQCSADRDIAFYVVNLL